MRVRSNSGQPDVALPMPRAGAVEGWSGRTKLPSPRKPSLRRYKTDRRHTMRSTHLQEPDVPKRDKSTSTDQQKRQTGAIEKGHEQKSVARPEAEPRAWASVNKLHGGGKKSASGRKVPSGPVGGSGRKTNLSRSS